jgi:membrane protease YdiL (CAAX protease family)
MALTDKTRPILIAAGYAAFCGLSMWARSVKALLGAVVVMGILLPLVWGQLTGELTSMGFSKCSVGQALLWGMGAGVVSSIAGLAVLPLRTVPTDLGRQLLIGLPLWLLVISPFQEFFFRGWVQGVLGEVLGERWALLIATACFVAWHYLSPIVDLATFPLTSVEGLLSTAVAGLAYGYAFYRSGSVIAPWLGHALSGLAFIVVGAMDLAQAMS